MLRGLLGIVLLLFGIQLGYSFGSPPIKNSMLEGKMKDIARNPGLRGENEIRRDVMAFVVEKNIPMQSAQLQVTMNGDKVGIAAHYKTRVEVLFLSRDYEFFPSSDPSVRMKPKRQVAAKKSARR